MLFKVDENLPVEAAISLCDAGHDALTIHDQQMVLQENGLRIREGNAGE